MPDYLDRDALLSLDLAVETVDRLLSASPLTGHDSWPVIEAEHLADLLAAMMAENRD
jgi:hypothetical protein